MARIFNYSPIFFFTACALLLAAFFSSIGKPKVKENDRSFRGATGWFNTEPLSLSKLKGKVVLIDFWTFTCINWRRTLPYVREWALKYKDQGLVVVGVHTPEFSFEHEPENVQGAINEMKITYPVAQDNRFAIWNSFENTYWPAIYLIDAKGHIRYQKFGEGDYDKIELEIQKLLKESKSNNVPTTLVSPDPDGYEVAPDWQSLHSGENFLGYDRTIGFASPGGLKYNKELSYAFPAQLQLNHWALEGQWIAGKEGVRLKKEGGKILYVFQARDLHLIMGSPIKTNGVRFRVLIDGRPPGSAHGVDVDSLGNGTVKEQRMYQIIRQEGAIVEKQFQIEFFDTDVEVYDFTFG